LRQVKGTTGEGLPAKKAQRKWQFGRVYSPGCGDGIPPAGRGGFHPERGATPVSNGRGFAFRNHVNRLSLAEQSYKGLPQWKTSKCLKIVLSGQAPNPEKSGYPSSRGRHPPDNLAHSVGFAAEQTGVQTTHTYYVRCIATNLP